MEPVAEEATAVTCSVHQTCYSVEPATAAMAIAAACSATEVADS